MRKVREILRLRYECGRALREIAVSCSVGAATVSDYLARAEAAGLTWPQAVSMSDAEANRGSGQSARGGHQVLVQPRG
jgi:hypothetical protein